MGAALGAIALAMLTPARAQMPAARVFALPAVPPLAAPQQNPSFACNSEAAWPSAGAN